MSLRAVLLTETIRPPLAGIGRYAWELATGLGQAEGVDLKLLSWGRWQAMPALREQVARAQRGQEAGNTVPGPASLAQRTKRHLKGWLGSQPSVAALYEAARAQLNRRALRSLEKAQPTIVHGPDYFAPVSDQPTVVTIHDLSVLLFPETQPITRVRRFEKLIDRAVRSGFTILTDAHSVADELVQHTGVALHRVNPIHLGVNGNFRPFEPSECAAVIGHYRLAPERYVLSVGTAEPRKNLVRLLDAYERLPAGVRHQFPLVLAGGKGWNDDALLQRIEKARAAGWLRTLGYVPEADLPALYAGARLFAYVSLYEGFGLPVAEAMACGTPVLTSDCSSMPEVAAGAALLVNPLDVDAITAGLQRGLEDETWRQGARSRGLTRAAELSWDNTVAATLAVYRKMLAA
jgi:alpha-1,3-rhamnosyl/mannosyltransferase